MKQVINTDKAPRAIGTYSQAIKAGNTVYISGQIGLDPSTMKKVEDDFRAEVNQVFKNLTAVVKASGGELSQIVKLNISIIEMENFALVNEIMANYFMEPYPARAVVGVKSLPKGVAVEVEGILILSD